MPAASRPGDGRIPKGHHSLGRERALDAGGQVDAFGGVIGHHLMVRVFQELVAKVGRVVPDAVRQRQSILRINFLSYSLS